MSVQKVQTTAHNYALILLAPTYVAATLVTGFYQMVAHVLVNLSCQLITSVMFTVDFIT